VRNARVVPATYFLGVRLTPEETSLLDRFQAANDLPHRSDAVRALIRGAGGAPAPGVELPATLHAALEEVVEEGYARDLDGAIATVLTLGLGELVRTHAERLPALRDRARSVADRRRERKRADREGRGLLGR
jgi:hypothetical protein